MDISSIHISLWLLLYIPEDESLCRTHRMDLLSIFVATEISRQWVVLNSLVKHEGEQTCSVGHRSSDVSLLFKKLVQLVPLQTKKMINWVIRKIVMAIDH